MAGGRLLSISTNRRRNNSPSNISEEDDEPTDDETLSHHPPKRVRTSSRTSRVVNKENIQPARRPRNNQNTQDSDDSSDEEQPESSLILSSSQPAFPDTPTPTQLPSRPASGSRGRIRDSDLTPDEMDMLDLVANVYIRKLIMDNAMPDEEEAVQMLQESITCAKEEYASLKKTPVDMAPALDILMKSKVIPVR
jgi:hypothetical protein